MNDALENHASSPGDPNKEREGEEKDFLQAVIFVVLFPLFTLLLSPPVTQALKKSYSFFSVRNAPEAISDRREKMKEEKSLAFLFAYYAGKIYEMCKNESGGET